MLEISHDDDLHIGVHHGVPHTSTTLVMCVYMNCLGKTMHAFIGWTHTYIALLQGFGPKIDLPWASDDHPMLEISHDDDLHIGVHHGVVPADTSTLHL